jgi:hypothetical protein
MSISFPTTPGVPAQYPPGGAASAASPFVLADPTQTAATTGLGSGLQSLATQMQGYLVQMQGTGTQTASATTGASAGPGTPAATRPHHHHRHQDDSQSQAETGLADNVSAQPASVGQAGSPSTGSPASAGGALANDMAKALQAYAALAPAGGAVSLPGG